MQQFLVASSLRLAQEDPFFWSVFPVLTKSFMPGPSISPDRLLGSLLTILPAMVAVFP